ncbi:dual specificity protein phosphatase family protein [Nocardiopsis sp. HNM0947]|uniref:Dual specificity protein phosphatase family protein n=1 Tax=Nocardiopsis coralli TaxID=2772213 RepID=A0ABR9P6K0_9ACTN|nr:dual specificity protein phosphatase family protein [Nocardiopsis coralli]MBE2999469.1 dual specificity protein phosphatase family protein [Nocardiopsis coralli]
MLPPDPTDDRAAGAACAPTAAARLHQRDPQHARAVTDLVHTALTAPHTATDPADRTWAHHLHALVHTRTPPPPTPNSADPRTASLHLFTHTPQPPHHPAQHTLAAHHLHHTLTAARQHPHPDTLLYTAALATAHWGISALDPHSLRALGHDQHTHTERALTALHGHHPDQWPHHPIRTRDDLRLPPFTTPHPHDHGVSLGNIDHLRTAPTTPTAAVSLCRTHPSDAPHLDPTHWVRPWLHDRPGANTNLHHTLTQAAQAVADLRTEGHHVFLHCWAGASRTPAVAALYAITHLGAHPRTALAQTITAVGGHLDNPSLAHAVADLAGTPLHHAHTDLFPQGMGPRRPDLPRPHETG